MFDEFDRMEEAEERGERDGRNGDAEVSRSPRCPRCGGLGYVREAPGPKQPCPLCGTRGELWECDLYTCGAATHMSYVPGVHVRCGVTVDGATLAQLLRADLPCVCGAYPVATYRPVPPEDITEDAYEYTFSISDFEQAEKER